MCVTYDTKSKQAQPNNNIYTYLSTYIYLSNYQKKVHTDNNRRSQKLGCIFSSGSVIFVFERECVFGRERGKNEKKREERKRERMCLFARGWEEKEKERVERKRREKREQTTTKKEKALHRKAPKTSTCGM